MYRFSNFFVPRVLLFVSSYVSFALRCIVLCVRACVCMRTCVCAIACVRACVCVRASAYYARAPLFPFSYPSFRKERERERGREGEKKKKKKKKKKKREKKKRVKRKLF